MSIYVDSSAWIKRYVEEVDSDRAEALLMSDQEWVTGRHTEVEMRRNLSRLLDGSALAAAKGAFRKDWLRTHVVALDDVVCNLASDIAEMTGARTLDALHLAAAKRVGEGALIVLTFDVRQAQAARQLGMHVLGA